MYKWAVNTRLPSLRFVVAVCTSFLCVVVIVMEKAEAIQEKVFDCCTACIQHAIRTLATSLTHAFAISHYSFSKTLTIPATPF